jgi:hypothetical protein
VCGAPDPTAARTCNHRRVETGPELVALFEISPHANRDTRVRATWHAEIAVRKAAVTAGIPENEVEITHELYGSVVIATGGDGRQFEARVVVNPELKGWSFPRRIDLPYPGELKKYRP